MTLEWGDGRDVEPLPCTRCRSVLGIEAGALWCLACVRDERRARLPADDDEDDRRDPRNPD